MTPEMAENVRRHGLRAEPTSALTSITHLHAETPANLQRAAAVGCISLGAFSYAVSGYLQDVHVGRYCSLGEDVQIGRGDHPTHFATTSPASYNRLWYDVMWEGPDSVAPPHPLASWHPKKLTLVGHDVWVGHGAWVSGGARIGTGAVIAAGAVVTHDVAPYQVVGGIPARPIRSRFAEPLVERLLSSRWWRYAPWQLTPEAMAEPEAVLRRVQELEDAEEPVYSTSAVAVASESCEFLPRCSAAVRSATLLAAG